MGPEIDLHVSLERPEHARAELDVRPHRVDVDEHAEVVDDRVREGGGEHEGGGRFGAHPEENPRVHLELEVRRRSQPQKRYGPARNGSDGATGRKTQGTNEMSGLHRCS